MNRRPAGEGGADRRGQPIDALLVKCENCALRNLPRAREFTDDELEAVSQFKMGDVVLEAGAVIQSASSESPHLWTLYSGNAIRYIGLEDGRRQILNFLFAGDLIGLQTLLYAPAEYSVEALTRVHLCVFERRGLIDLIRSAPELGYDMTWITARELSFVDLNLVAVGKFRAEQRIAYLLLTYFERMRARGLCDDLSCAFPLRQHHVADALGLSLPYTNHALNSLISDRMIAINEQRLEILDWQAFTKMAVIEPAPRKSFRFI